MKILYLMNTDFGQHGTIGFRAYPTAKLLKKNKDDLIIFCRDYADEKFKYEFNIHKVMPLGNIPMKIVNGLKVYVLKNIDSNKINADLFEKFLIKKLEKIDLKEIQIVHSWDFLPKTFKYIKKKNPKVKIIKDLTMSYAIILKDIAKKEKYWSTIPKRTPKIELSCKKWTDYYIHPAKRTEQSILMEGIKKSQSLYIPYGVDHQKIKPLKNKKYDGKFKVCFAGNVNHRKGIGYLIDAWKKLNLKNAELNIYGRVYPEVSKTGHMEDKEKYNIITHGFVNIAKEMPKNHVLVHASLLDSTPKTLMESMAAGLVPIVTNNAGPNFENKKQGFIVKEQSAKQIAEKLKLLYDNRKLLEKMSKDARKFAEKRSWYKEYAGDVYNNYKKILKNN